MPVSTVAQPIQAHLAPIRNRYTHQTPKKRVRPPTEPAARALNADRPHLRHSRAQRREATCLIILITSTTHLHVSPQWPRHTPLYAHRAYVPSPWKRYPDDPKPASPQRPRWGVACPRRSHRSRASAPALSLHRQLRNPRPTEALYSLATPPQVIRQHTYSVFRTCTRADERGSTRSWRLVRTGSAWP